MTERRLTCRWNEAHGILGNPSWTKPLRVVECDLVARPGYTTTLAHEYEDEPEVLREKVELLAYFLTLSKQCAIYSGAGLSTASGISDYATKTRSGSAKLKSVYSAQPTLAHHILTDMYNHGLFQRWINQNHDGLPQKAGFPQEAINEIHGAWYDPTNPVVPMSGSLREDLLDDMLSWEQRSELTIAIGTSMCGMYADCVFTTVAEKAILELKPLIKESRKKNFAWQKNPTLFGPIGGVIIGIQQTQHDSLSSLRIFSRIDIVMSMLHDALHLPPLPLSPPPIFPSDIVIQSTITNDVFRVRYSNSGMRLPIDQEEGEGYEENYSVPTQTAVLDLRVGSGVRLVGGPYDGDEGIVSSKTPFGYKMTITHTLDYRNQVKVDPYLMEHRFGQWWVESAVRGNLLMIPVVNIDGGSSKGPTKKKRK
jgi:hypothetical protein